MDNSFLFQKTPDLKLMDSRKQEIIDNLKTIQILKDLIQTGYWKRLEKSLMAYHYKTDNNFLQFLEGQRFIINELKNLINTEEVFKNHLNNPEGG